MASRSNGILKANRTAGDIRAKNISWKMDFAYKRGKHEIPRRIFSVGILLAKPILSAQLSEI